MIAAPTADAALRGALAVELATLLLTLLMQHQLVLLAASMHQVDIHMLDGPFGATLFAGKIAHVAHELPHRLTGRLIGLATCGKRRIVGGTLDRALQLHSGKHPLAGKIGRVDVHQQRGVGVVTVAGEIAHAVGYHAALLARGGNHLAARAHAEGVHAAPTGQMLDQLVLGSAERRMHRGLTPLRLVDHALGMLDAHADAERLAFHDEALLMYHFESVPRRMPASQNHLPHLARELLAVFDLAQASLGNLSFAHHKTRKLHTEMNLAAQGNDFLAHGLDYARQIVRAQVRVRLPQNLVGGTGVHEPMEHVGRQLVFKVGGQLAIRESPGAAFAELDVGARVELGQDNELVHILGTAINVVALLHQHGLKAASCQVKSAKQSGRAGSHHKRGHGRRLAAGDLKRLVAVMDLLHMQAGGRLFEQTLLMPGGKFQAQGDHRMDVLFLAGVDAALHHLHGHEVRLRNRQGLCGGTFNAVGTLRQKRVEGQGQI